MRETQLAALVAALLQTQGQRELLAHLLTQEQLRDGAVYQHEESRLQHRRRQALQGLVAWLHRMGLEDEMLQLMQREACERAERLRQSQQAQPVVCSCVWCRRKRPTIQTSTSSWPHKRLCLQTPQEEGES